LAYDPSSALFAFSEFSTFFSAASFSEDSAANFYIFSASSRIFYSSSSASVFSVAC